MWMSKLIQREKLQWILIVTKKTNNKVSASAQWLLQNIINAMFQAKDYLWMIMTNEFTAGKLEHIPLYIIIPLF